VKLREEWRGCTSCELGSRRIAAEGEFVFGEGLPRGIMFIGEAPTKEDEGTGRPFTGKSGQIVRKIIEKI
jgi:DNA polymerase